MLNLSRNHNFARGSIEVEADEQGSFVGNQFNQRWIWYAVEHATNTVLASVFGRRKDEVFETLKKLLSPFPISRYYTDDWGATHDIYPLIGIKLASAIRKKLSGRISTLSTRLFFQHQCITTKASPGHDDASLPGPAGELQNTFFDLPVLIKTLPVVLSMQLSNELFYPAGSFYFKD